MNTQPKKIKILHLEDLSEDVELVERELKKGQFAFEKIVVDNKKTFEKALEEFSPDIVLSDHSLPSFNSFEALQIVQAKGLPIPFILITASMPDEFAVAVMQKGADDYIIKDRLQRLNTAIHNSLEKYRLEKEKQEFLEQIAINEKRYRTIIEKSNDMITLTTGDGKILYGSPSITKLFNYTQEELTHTLALDLVHPEDPCGIHRKKKPGFANSWCIYLSANTLKAQKWKLDLVRSHNLQYAQRARHSCHGI